MKQVIFCFLLISLFVACSSPSPRIIVVTATPLPSPQIIVVTATATAPVPVSTLTPLPTPSPQIDVDLANKIRALGCITYDEASAFMGQSKCVGGKVVAVFQDPGSTTFFINFDATRTGFYAVSFKERYDDLQGKCILVSGKIDRYSGRPQIIINDRSQIKLCE